MQRLKGPAPQSSLDLPLTIQLAVHYKVSPIKGSLCRPVPETTRVKGGLNHIPNTPLAMSRVKGQQQRLLKCLN